MIPERGRILASAERGSGSGGLGWFIYENKNELEIARVFAGLGTVIVIGPLVKNVVSRTLEEKTVRKWGMQRQECLDLVLVIPSPNGPKWV